MLDIYINPTENRIWQITLEPQGAGAPQPPVLVHAKTFYEAILIWWKGDAEDFPANLPIQLGNCLSGILTFYISLGNDEWDFLYVQDITDQT